MDRFVHLHVHSEYSLLDGACRIKELLSHVKDMGQSSIAITDHGTMYGVIDFYKEAKKVGIKPIIGCEVYVAKRTRFDKVFGYDSRSHHLVLLCKNYTGYQNLINLVSAGFLEGFYNKPRIDEDLLAQHCEGLIALSACLAGKIPSLLLSGDYNGARETALKYNFMFGEGNFYLELQDHSLPQQKKLNPLLVRLAGETGIPLVITNDCHYTVKEDTRMHEVLMCIQTNRTMKDPDKMEFGSDEFYVKSGDQMLDLFPEIPEAFENTSKIADMCNIEFNFGTIQLPHFEPPAGKSSFEYFREKCYSGLYRYYGDSPDPKIVDRLKYELDTINHMGYVDYYLIVYDFVDYARSIGISVGPGRGSGAGSLAAFCIGITGIDPIRYNLLFERFLNPERVSMPDFDIDFCYVRRQEVIDYVVSKYGHDHVAQIITFGTMAARGAIRDVGRALAIPYSVVDSVAKLIPIELGVTISRALLSSPDLKNLYQSNPEITELIDMARKLEGMPRHASTHAAGVVITERPVCSYVPLAKNDDAIVTQFTMTTLEELGLLKMDFLGLRTLTVISDTEKTIRITQPEFSIDKIDLSDKDVYHMISRGETEGIFQFESTGMKNVLTQLKPTMLEDLIAVISLYRPGPMNSIPKYIENRHCPEKITYKHPLLANILDVTYGCVVYQEQVMQIFRELAGYSLGRADIVRRAMSKKKADVMEKEREIFINGLVDEYGAVIVDGCIRRGVSPPIAVEIFTEIESFASYAFNKSHAAAYALIAYQTAFLKCKHPREYMAALLTSVLDNSDKIASYISLCGDLGIAVLPPCVNQSNEGFTVCSNDIRFGLLAVKNLGRGAIRNILNEQHLGKFSSFYDFCERISGKDINKRAVESLIKCGALDGLSNANRHQMLAIFEKLIDDIDSDRKNNIKGQIGFFDVFPGAKNTLSITFPDLPEFSNSELLSMEKEVTGMYLSGHPLSQFSELISARGFTSIGDIVTREHNIACTFHNEDHVKVLAIVSSVKLKTTKKSNIPMAFCILEDIRGCIEMLVFPAVFERYSYLIKEDTIVLISARVSMKEDEEPKLICESICSALDIPHEPTTPSPNETKKHRPGLYIKVDSFESDLYSKVENLLGIFDGGTPVYIFFENTKKFTLAPRKLWVDPNHVLVSELRKICSESAVILRNG